MYAVVNTGGKQAKVESGSIIAVEKLDAKVGDTVSLPVLMVVNGDKILVTPAEVAGASVTAEVLEHFKGEKQMIFKFKKRKGYKRTKGHRQLLTSILILDIATTGGAKTAKAKPEAAPKAEKSAKAEVAPKAEKPAKAEAATKAPKAAKVEAPAAQSGQCVAVKSDGTRCTNKAKEGSKYCGVHAKKYEG